MTSIAYFITPHGFGHAARGSAIMSAVSEAVPFVSFDIFTTVPEWFFKESFSGQFEYHEFVSDIGLVQKSPFSHDLQATIETLERFIPFDAGTISDTADFLQQRACQLVVCDISPIGISIAAKAGIPSILIENFTWDWIYEDFIEVDDRICRYVDFFRGIYRSVDYHIQASPVCNPSRACLMTGRYPHRTGSIDTLEWRGLERLGEREVVGSGAAGEQDAAVGYGVDMRCGWMGITVTTQIIRATRIYADQQNIADLSRLMGI